MTSPRHVAIIMDGNGRWAQSHGHPRVYGHVRGAKIARQIIEESTRIGIQYLTLYAFSTENWKRPPEEVSVLMRLLRRHLIRELKTLMANNIRFRAIGELHRLPAIVLDEIRKTESQTAKNTGMTLTFALSYGGRQDITSAAQSLARDVAAGKLAPDQISEKLISERLSTSYAPDPDLIIRTSGESRISNFLLWQAAYSEFYITPVLWPDFGPKEYQNALLNFQQRERRFGMTSAQAKGLATPQGIL